MKRTKSAIVGVLLNLICSLPFTRGDDTTTVDEFVAAFANKVASACQKHNAAKLVLRFDTPTFSNVSVHSMAGVETGRITMTRLVQEELKKLGMPTLVKLGTHKLDASTEFTGLNAEGEDLQPNDEMELFTVTVRGELTDANGKVVETVTMDQSEAMNDPDGIATLFGPNFGSGKQNSEPPLGEIISGLDAAPFVFNRTAYSSPESKLGMQILVKGEPADITIDDGFGFVSLKENDEFEVAAINDGEGEVAVELVLDGIHANHYRGSRFYRILKSGARAVYQGWDMDNAKFYKFKITPFEKSVAAELGEMHDLGTIQLQFRSSRGVGYKSAAYSDTPTVGVGKGEIGQGKARETVQREFGPVISSVVVRFVRNSP